MSRYQTGDVVLVPITIDTRTGVKVRPAVVIRISGDHDLEICPISSKPSSDAPSVPISLDDFSRGGLDLFHESYILTSRVCRIRCDEIIGKKGRLTDKITTSLPVRVPQAQQPDSSGTKNNKSP